MTRSFIIPFVSTLVLLASASCSAASGTPRQAEPSPARIEPTSAAALPPSSTPISAATSSPSPTALPAPTETPAPTATFPPSPTPTLQPGAARSDPESGMIYVFVPSGEFLMGSTHQDPGADLDEFPQHILVLDPYWIGQTEVTNSMFAAFLNEMGNQIEGRAAWLSAMVKDVLILQNPQGQWEPKQGFGNFPVVEVTWYGAQSYCKWAGGRLPTEAEWEKAARGGDDRLFPWGDQEDCRKAFNVMCRGTMLLPVGSHPDNASPYGALDLSGNVWEWVADWYDPGYYAISPMENPLGPDSGLARVVRGGSWKYNAKHARLTDRRNDGPSSSKPDYGFRCVIPAY